MEQVVAIICVIGLAVGQILFKLCANSLNESGSYFNPKVLFSLFAAMCLYGVTSLVWVWLLQKDELGKIYPFVALGFVFVPIGSYFIFDERFNVLYILGVAFIAIGIFVIAKG